MHLTTVPLRPAFALNDNDILKEPFHFPWMTSVRFGLMLQVSLIPLFGVAQVNITVLPSLTFFDLGVTEINMADSIPAGDTCRKIYTTD